MLSRRVVALSAACMVVFSGLALANATGTRLDRDRPPRAEKPAEDKVWFYQTEVKAVGPLTTEDLVDAAEDGDIKPTTKVYHPEAGWRVASLVPELKEALN